MRAAGLIGDAMGEAKTRRTAKRLPFPAENKKQNDQQHPCRNLTFPRLQEIDDCQRQSIQHRQQAVLTEQHAIFTQHMPSQSTPLIRQIISIRRNPLKTQPEFERLPYPSNTRYLVRIIVSKSACRLGRTTNSSRSHLLARVLPAKIHCNRCAKSSFRF